MVGNLPLRTTSFVGRAAEVSRVRELLLDPDRLVTLAGSGEAGKTALGIEVARAVAPAFPDGVCWSAHFVMECDAESLYVRLITVAGQYPVPASGRCAEVAGLGSAWWRVIR